MIRKLILIALSPKHNVMICDFFQELLNISFISLTFFTFCIRNTLSGPIYITI